MERLGSMCGLGSLKLSSINGVCSAHWGRTGAPESCVGVCSPWVGQSMAFEALGRRWPFGSLGPQALALCASWNAGTSWVHISSKLADYTGKAQSSGGSDRPGGQMQGPPGVALSFLPQMAPNVRPPNQEPPAVEILKHCSDSNSRCPGSLSSWVFTVQMQAART